MFQSYKKNWLRASKRIRGELFNPRTIQKQPCEAFDIILNQPSCFANDHS